MHHSDEAHTVRGASVGEKGWQPQPAPLWLDVLPDDEPWATLDGMALVGLPTTTSYKSIRVLRKRTGRTNWSGLQNVRARPSATSSNRTEPPRRRSSGA
jgi:hypothetical protein